MAPPAERPQLPTTFEHTAQIKVRRAEFVLLASVPYLDLAKLARAPRAEIELGYYKTESSRHFVRAIVEEGMVTDLAMDPCWEDEPRPASPELVRLFKLAREHVTPSGSEPFRPPVPVADFMPNAVAMSIGTLVCYQICIGGFCFICCHRVDTDWSLCGSKITIDTT